MYSTCLYVPAVEQTTRNVWIPNDLPVCFGRFGMNLAFMILSLKSLPDEPWIVSVRPPVTEIRQDL